jgi:hypothetical protein
MTALGRYVTASCLDSLRWVPPGLIFVLGLTAAYASGGQVLATLEIGASWLFPITAWVTVNTLNDEDPSRAAITAAAAGGLGRARAAKLIVAGCVGGLMTLISLALAFAVNVSHFTPSDLAMGFVAHAISVVAGVSLGSLVSRPIVSRTAPAVLTIIAFTVVDLAVPYAPPIRVMLSALNRLQTHQQWAVLGLGVAETVVLSAIVFVVSFRVARARS